ncbi:hypothetical protein [Demequina sp. NBRC 110053]|uniref:primosomal protein N' family DNA-binding protein n=1 Tax=Demequina sp. NBRC 110053 TaxID=1570342 RepID=UPI000A0722AD|nr:hypothetical protein [Demequina sp. NBRC 110053]
MERGALPHDGDALRHADGSGRGAGDADVSVPVDTPGSEALFDLAAPDLSPARAPSDGAAARATAEAVEAGAVATVCIDSPLPHLDRPFDYIIPSRLRDQVAVGTRVRVPFRGSLTSAVVTDVGSGSGFEGTLSPLRTAAARPSTTAEGIALARRVARRYGGSLWDVLRLAMPPRAASVDKRAWEGDSVDAAVAALQPEYAAAAERSRAEDPESARSLAGELASLASGDRIVWQALPETSPRASAPVHALVSAALTVVADADPSEPAGASAIVIVPDARALAAVLAELERLGLRRWTSRSGGHVAVLDHDDGPATRYGSYLAALHGHARIVLGTRPTVMQPVPRLGLIAVWDEANGVYEDPHAPYPHARTVAAMRAEDGAGMLLGGYALSAEAVALTARGWARLLLPEPTSVRASAPAIELVTPERRDAEGASGWHWMPGSVWRDLRKGLETGPVAVVVPRTGYVRAAACARCDAWATCRECDSLLMVPAHASDPQCVDSGHDQPDWHCQDCHGSALKQVRQGADRIGEQLARMLGDVPLTVSTAAAGVSADGSVTEGVVLATPGALPAVAGGYAHLVVLDAGVAAAMALGGELNALRWWLGAAALARPRRDGGRVSIIGVLPPAVEEALVTWSPAEAASAEVAEREALGLPPHRRHLAVTGDAGLVATAVERVGRDRRVTTVPIEGGSGLLVPRALAQDAIDAVRALQREASREGRELRLRVDGPLVLAQ